MRLFHINIDGTPTLETFNPLEVVETLIKLSQKYSGQIPAVDVYTTEVK